jgi:DNA replicative helicase MCM subunit Mcm2 (Cdc46/Mcm family)
MDLYDCKDQWEVTTQIRGKELLTNLCTNFFGGVTPKGLARSVPEEASEDGFLSRCVLVYQKSTNRVYSEPKIVGPSTEELSKKLAWIAEKTFGVHSFSPEAKKFYDKWYKEWRKILESAERPYASSRMAVQARQLSLVLKASRFSPSPIIELQDIEDATKIIEKTAGTYKGLFEKVEVNAFFDKLSVLESRFMKKKKLNRRELLVNSRYTSEELNELLSHLVQTGRVRIFRNGTESSYASKDGKEEYRWVNGVRPLQEVQDEGSD